MLTVWARPYLTLTAIEMLYSSFGRRPVNVISMLMLLLLIARLASLSDVILSSAAAASRIHQHRYRYTWIRYIKTDIKWIKSLAVTEKPRDAHGITRMNLSCFIRMWAQVSFVFFYNPRIWQTDRQTYGQTDGQKSFGNAVCCIYMQSHGKNTQLVFDGERLTGALFGQCCLWPWPLNHDLENVISVVWTW